MKKVFLACVLTMIALCAYAREVKISVTPSNAKIFVDGNYVADGVTTVNVTKKNRVVEFDNVEFIQ